MLVGVAGNGNSGCASPVHHKDGLWRPSAQINDLPVLPPDLIRRLPADDELTASLEEICRRHAVIGPDGVTLLVMAHPKHADTG